MARRMSESSFVESARTRMRAREGSLRVFPIVTSWRSNVPPIMRIVSNTFARISESMMCPVSTTVSWAAAIRRPPYLDFITRRTSPGLGRFHQLTQHARRIGARLEAEGQSEHGPVERPFHVGQGDTKRTTLPPKAAGFGRLDEARRRRTLLGDDRLLDLAGLTAGPGHPRAE